MKSGRYGLVHDLLFGDSFLAEEAVDERRAGLGSARAHAGPGYGLDLVDVAVALADQGPDLAGRHAFAAADDRVVGRALDVAGHGLRDLVVLDPERRRPFWRRRAAS